MSFADEKRGIEDRFKRQMHLGADNIITTALTVSASGRTVSRSSGSFVTDGVQVGQYVSLLDFVNEGNNQVFKVEAVAALSLTLVDPLQILVDEMGMITSLAFPAVPIAYESIPFEPEDTNQVYVTCYVIQGDGRQITLGSNPFFRYVGYVQNSIFGPQGVGTDFARVLSDRIAKIWRNIQFSFGSSGVFTFFAPSLSFIERNAFFRLGVRNGQYRLDVITPYHRDIQF